MRGLHHRRWCDHQALCPSFGGTPPPFPDVVPGPDSPLPHQRAAVEAAHAAAARNADVAGPDVAETVVAVPVVTETVAVVPVVAAPALAETIVPAPAVDVPAVDVPAVDVPVVAATAVDVPVIAEAVVAESAAGAAPAPPPS